MIGVWDKVGGIPGNVLIWEKEVGVVVFTRVYQTVGGRWGSPVYPVSGDIREKRPPALPPLSVPLSACRPPVAVMVRAVPVRRPPALPPVLIT